MAFFIDFVALAAIGLTIDRVAFSQLCQTASSFWPSKSVNYGATLFPRMLLLPVGAALSAHAQDAELDTLSMIGLTLIVAPVAVLCILFIREWFKARPRP